MKELTLVLAAMFVASSVSAGLFDTITKSTGVNFSTRDNQQEGRDRVTRKDRKNGKAQGAEDVLGKMKEIDDEIDSMPKSTSILGYSFGPVSDAGQNMDNDEVTEVQLSQSDKELMSSAFCECFSKMRIHRESDCSIGTIELVGEQKTLVNASSRSMYKTAMYKCLRYINHNFEVVPSDAVGDFMKYNGYTIPPPRFRTKLSDDGCWSGEFDSNGPYFSLRITDLTAHKRAKEAEEKRLAQKQAEQEKRRKEERRQREAEGQKRAAAAERLRVQAQAADEARKREQAAKEIKINRVGFASGLRSCRDGNVRTSIDLKPQTIAAASQFPEKPIITSKVPLFKAIVSGSTLLWSIGQLDVFTDRDIYGKKIEIQAMQNIGIDGFDYDGITVLLPEKGSSSDTLRLYCTSEGLGVEDFVDIEVFGVGKTFPGGVTAEAVISKLKTKYANLKITTTSGAEEAICLDLAGMKRKTVHARHEFSNGDVRGVVVEDKFEFVKVDLQSAEASYVVCLASLGALKRANEFVAVKFEESLQTHILQARADVKNGKYKNELVRFNFTADTMDDFRRGACTFSREMFFVVTVAAKKVLPELSFSPVGNDAVERARAELDNLQVEMSNPKSILASAPKVHVSLKVFDAKALDILSGYKRVRIDKNAHDKAAKENEKKAQVLDF